MDDRERQEGEVDPSLLHPSVRFYRGMWRLTQLREEKADAVAAPTKETPSNATTTVKTGFSVVGLHQRLLPPAPMTGFGEIADENYAAQLATVDGIELLRVNWHLLLALLFPCSTACSDLPADAAERGSATIVTTGEVDNGGDAVPPESTWTAEELYRRVQQPLTEADLKVVREPGHMDRLYYSYIVLLRFFGWRVHDEERGLLDRNRAWAERYAALEVFRRSGSGGVEDVAVASPSTLPPVPPAYASFDFYRDGLPRVLRGLLDVGFLRLAVRLVEFVMEEVKAGRLLFLLALVEETLLPLIVGHEHVEESHKTRLKKQLYRLTHSDSD